MHAVQYINQVWVESDHAQFAEIHENSESVIESQTAIIWAQKKNIEQTEYQYEYFEKTLNLYMKTFISSDKTSVYHDALIDDYLWDFDMTHDW